MSTTASVAPRVDNREYPSLTLAHTARRKLDRGHSLRGRHPDPALAYLHAEWGDIALAVVKRRAADRQSTLRSGSGQQGARPSNERRSPEAAS